MPSFLRSSDISIAYHHNSYPLLDHLAIQEIFETEVNDCSGKTLRLSMLAIGALVASTRANTASSEPIGRTCHESYFLSAIASVPFRIHDCSQFGFLQAFGLLTLYSLTISNYSAAHRYLALYHALVAQDGFHDERRWPKSLSIRDLENRRRVFWTMYRLEIHSACLSGHVVRLPEAQAAVLYPMGSSPLWNHLTDLHRLLEHSLSMMRPPSTVQGFVFFENLAQHPEDLRRSFLQLKLRKPSRSLGPLASKSAEEIELIEIHEMQTIFAETLLSVLTLLQLKASIAEVVSEVDEGAEKMMSINLQVLRRGDAAMVSTQTR